MKAHAKETANGWKKKKKQRGKNAKYHNIDSGKNTVKITRSGRNKKQKGSQNREHVTEEAENVR